ncbi:conserved hypothetical protein [Leishmania mexicana MHOM/GT/2001/U1103]|uniref:CCHC-type domain-containing protein n=1 Tax=Leishmania mexicana (strain MHOM/GT/2001/U1103) TaxID=929439 RepID=E9AJE2_LEIMU|nr:conserved hypothetical protein [Leishmania mexicana MHOM/GT/2001/U1103]CBZ23039.1 conserved hypothetical protein [Leishmania mexicana MHOM/GT/2001/U1103]
MARTKSSRAPLQPHESVDTTAEAAPALSFLVYPVPSIADASFLQLIFRNTVRRSLFLGFGRGRVALAELASAAVAAEVEAIIHKAAAAVAGPEDGAAAAQDASGLAAGAAPRHGAPERLAGDDDFEHMTLADLFAPPPGSASQGSASAPRQEHQPSNNGGGTAAGGESLDFSHLPYLVWRDRPVHVVVSGVRVADFYGSGGAVPEHHVKRTTDAEEQRSGTKLKRPNTGKRTRDDADSTAALSSPPVANQQAVAEERAQGSGALDAAVTAAAVPKSRFPKDCCQKCGSADHFTRHCDGSGTTTTTTSNSSGLSVAAVPCPSVAVGVDQQPQHESVAAAVAAPTPRPAKAKPLVQRTSKDQCKYCGSEAHLSRHCPSKS